MILDTNAVSDFFREPPPPSLIRILEEADVHHLPVIVLGEFRYGVRFSRSRSLLESKLDRLIETNTVLHLDEDTSRFYADVRTDLKKRGLPIPENDLWISALCLQHNLALVTRDTHFLQIHDLNVKTWQRPP